MYKSRFYLWIIILCLVYIVKLASNLDVSSLIVKYQEVNTNIETDISVKSIFTSAQTGPLKLVQTTENPSIIIKNNSNESIEGYDKLENAIYSPIILYIPTDYDTPSNLYYSLGDNVKFVSFKNICNAIINETTLKDLGIDSDKLKDKKIVLNIPSEESFYYDEVIEQIYISLNNNKIPNETERKALEPTVKKLLEKCVICNDVSKKIEEKEKNVYNIFIAPEFYLKDSNLYSIETNLGYYQSVYFEKTTRLSYDIYIKKDEFFGKDSLKDVVIKYLIKNERFADTSSYRTSFGHDYDSIFPARNANILDMK